MSYFAFGETFVEEHRNSHNLPYKYNAKELDEETGYYYYDARYYNPQISAWLSVDPLAERHPDVSPYAYVLNNPIYYIDPDGRTEYPSYAAYRKAQGGSALSRQDMWKQGHWLYSDRNPNSWSGAVTRRSSVFNNAAALNTANGRSGDYANLGQRKAYYRWAKDFYQQKGYGVKWFSAAKNVVGDLEKALSYGGIGRVITGGSYGTNDRINSFIKAGNKAILDDVIGRISDLASGGALTGNDAKLWDSQTLSNEQNAIQPLYGSMLNSGDINILNNNVELNYGDNWDSSWSVSNQSHRWALGMRVM